MQVPIQLKSEAGRTLQDQLFHEIVHQIEDGRLRPGTRMPATRQLALDLAVSRNTVAFAYERLTAEGFIEARVPYGTFVSQHSPRPFSASKPPVGAVPAALAAGSCRSQPLFQGSMHLLRSPHHTDAPGLRLDFWVGRPDPRLFPAQTWRRLIEDALTEDMRRGDGSYGEPAGLGRLRAALAGHVGAARSIVCDEQDVIITNGIQEGINLVARLLVSPGVSVGMENPGYAGAAHVLESYGASLLPVDVDAEGAVPRSLPRDCRLMYLTPAHQYPTGVALSKRRRAEWLQWAASCGGYLIEDDYDGDFYFDSVPLPALKAEDQASQVIYLGTFSKCLSPGLRLGYMIVPPELKQVAVAAKGLLTNGSPWLVQSAMAAFIEGGEFGHHLRRLRKRYAGRRSALLTALERVADTVRATGAHAGMHVLWRLAQEAPTAAEVEKRLLDYGVGVYGLASGNTWLADRDTERRFERSLLLGYAALTEEELTAGIETVSRVLRAG